MERGLIIVVLLVAVTLIHGLTVTSSGHLTQQDKARLKRVFDSASPYQDLATAHYALLGYKLLGETIPNAQELCKYVQTQLESKNVESVFYASGASKVLGNCPLPTTANAAIQETLNSAIVEGVSSQTLYFAVTTMKNLNMKYDSAKIGKILTAARKKDDGALSLGYALHVASLLTTDVSSFVDWIEDTVVQADEVDGRMLQFEGGLSVSAIVVSGIYRLAEIGKKSPPAIDGDKCVKFANYFLSRKQVQVVRPAFYLLDILQVLSNNKIHVPVSVSLVSSQAVSVTQPKATIRISNLVGGSLGAMTLTLDTIVKIADKSSVAVAKPFTPATDKQSYEIDLVSAKLKRGHYQLNINAKPNTPDPRLVGIVGAKVLLKLVTEVGIENVEVGVGDVDQSSAPRMIKVQFPGKLQVTLEADYHQKIQMKFTLTDKVAKDTMTVHQAFIVLTHKKTNREIVFVAEPDSTNVYKFDLDVQSKSKDFGSLSGIYELVLVVGDSVISNPIFWQVADVEITFQEQAVTQRSEVTYYGPKPEIKHLFREPDKRPAPVVSNAFTILGLVPLVLLFILWAKIGVNVSNFSVSLGSIGFHLGLAGIFGLFVVFWLKLTMFETLKYLILLGIVTFLCGNSMLSKLAALHK